MIRLGQKKNGVTLELFGGVTITCPPFDSAINSAAHHAAAEAVAKLREAWAEAVAVGAPTEHLPDFDDASAVYGIEQIERATELCIRSATSWAGVYGLEGDEPLPLTRENVRLLMLEVPYARQFIDKYYEVVGSAVAEGNGSRLAPNGTSAAGQTTAEGAAPQEDPARTVPQGSMENTAPTA